MRQLANRYLTIVSFLVLGILATINVSNYVFAVPDPALTGAATVAGLKNTSIPIDLQVAGTGNPSVPVKLFVTSGSLAMSTTTGLTFTGPSTGSSLQFSGTLTNVNAALATLAYTRSVSGTDTIEASLVSPGEVFFPGTGNLYEYVAATYDWGQARDDALTRTKYGAVGYLTTITSQGENDFVADRLTNAGWMGASDAAVEDAWRWVTGPESGTQFWQGDQNGSAFGGGYENWNTSEPNDSGSNEDCGQFLAGASGNWNDLPCSGTTLPGYVVEYGAPGARPDVSSLDVAVTTYSAPNAPSSLGSATYVSGGWTSDTTPLLQFSLSDTDSGEQVGYRVIIDDSSDFSSPVVDYTSALAAQGARNFTVGQDAGTGAYAVGASGQTLAEGAYYWRVKAIDAQTYESAYTVANSGSIAFGVDTTSPTTPTFTSTALTNDSTPEISWTASTDSGSGLSSVQAYTLDWSMFESFSPSYDSADSLTTSVTTFNTLTDGTWYLRLVARDNVSNTSAQTLMTIVVDTGAPTLTATVPQDEAVDITRDSTIALTFDEEVTIGAGDLEVYKVSDDSLVDVIDVSTGAITGDGTDEITITLNETLAYGTEYYVLVDIGAFTDLAGNDFAGIADATSWSFSTLADPDPDNDGIPNAVEDAAPNNGDANNDGVKDSTQTNVSSVINEVDDNYVTLAAPSSCDISEFTTLSSSSIVKDAEYSYPHGLLDFTLDCGTPGATITVEQFYYGVTDVNFALRKYDQNNELYGNVSGLIEPLTIGGKSVLKVVYQITDGGPLDMDGIANGTIVDPIGLGVGSSLANTGENIVYTLVAGFSILSLTIMSVLFREKYSTDSIVAENE